VHGIYYYFSEIFGAFIVMRRNMVKKSLLNLLLVGITTVNIFGATPLLKPGTWRAVLQRPDGQQIVFNFETQFVKGKQLLYVLNAGERLLVDNIRRKNDSLWIQMPFFASGFAAKVKKDGNLEGLYIKNYGTRKQEIPFYAENGAKERYAVVAKPQHDITGRWAVNFGSKDDAESKAVGEFEQQTNGKITGTFLTPTGDYRYLEGAVSADTLKLSGFDGGHAILFTAKLNDNNSISEADIYSGLTGHEKWTAKKDANAQLPDEYTFTKLREGETKLNFRFPSTKGDVVSINDERYKNKVVIIQILGSWCPNCMDETAFLSDYYNRNHDKGVEVIGLAYERTSDFAESKAALIPFQERFKVQYPILITGVEVSDKQRTEKTLPQLESIKAFPTSIIIDKKGNIRKIHSGFNGPGTGEHYTEFKKEFEETMSELLREK